MVEQRHRGGRTGSHRVAQGLQIDIGQFLCSAYFGASGSADGTRTGGAGACGRITGGGRSSKLLVSSRTTVLLASLNSRRTFPAVRTTSGSRSGGITITAFSTSSRTSKMTRVLQRNGSTDHPFDPPCRLQ